MNRRFALACLGLGLLCALPACDSSDVKLAPVKGQVTFKGKPLVGANIKFYPADGPMAVGITDDTGSFRLTTNGRVGAVLGGHKVAITKMTGEALPAVAAAPSPDDMRKKQMANMNNKASGPKSEIPETYGSPDASKLTADVSSTGSENEFLFELQ